MNEIRKLERGVDQPFYQILGYHDWNVYEAEGNDDRYRLYIVNELILLFADNLEIGPSRNYAVFSHDIGIHFDRWDGLRFVPNAEKMAHFPDDDAIATQLLA